MCISLDKYSTHNSLYGLPALFIPFLVSVRKLQAFLQTEVPPPVGMPCAFICLSTGSSAVLEHPRSLPPFQEPCCCLYMEGRGNVPRLAPVPLGGLWLAWSCQLSLGNTPCETRENPPSWGASWALPRREAHPLNLHVWLLEAQKEKLWHLKRPRRILAGLCWMMPTCSHNYTAAWVVYR